MTDRRRNLFVLLLVLGLLIGSAAVLATKPTKKGLDLQGGVELIYQAKGTSTAPVNEESLDQAIDVMQKRINQLGVAEPEIQRTGDNQISVALPAVDNLAEAIEQVGTVAQLAFYDWEVNVVGPSGRPEPEDPSVTGGRSAGRIGAISLYEAVLRASKRPGKVEPNNARKDSIFYAVDPKSKKVFGSGVGKAVRYGESTKAEALSRVPRALRDTAKTYEVKPNTIIIRGEQEDGAKQLTDQFYVLEDDVALQGKEVKNPKQASNTGAGGDGLPNVTFEFTDKGAGQWQKVTREIADRGSRSVGLLPGQTAADANQHFAIVLDDELISAPYIDFRRNSDGIDGRGTNSIEGGFTLSSAQQLAKLLKTGALPLDLELIASSQVSATLGAQALSEGLTAGIAGFLIVAIFLLIFYRVLGVIAVAALAIYALYFYALIKLIPVTLTLPGIAGLILTLGVAADANIVIFERVKEEIRAGRSVMAGIAAGYKKGLTAIIDANVVTIMVAFILFVLATAGVKGFALTLGLGVIVSLFTAVLATQAILGTMSKSRLISSPSALGAADKKNAERFRIDYMGYSKWFFSASGVILLVCALALGSKGINFGIDFESGTRINVALTEKASVDQVREVLAKNDQAGAEVQTIENKDSKGASNFQISTATLGPTEVTKITAALKSEFGFADTEDSSSIGPTFGQTVAKSAIIAIIASLLVISSYIALRFEPKYAVPVLIALMHDILITAGVYALFGQEVTTATVAALLTILGFSLYDTIIVFDRIRENVPRMPRAAFSQIVNRSMSEVIVRSLATSFCSGLPVLALMLFGGETLRAFAFALLVGTISGTYSSVFIAGPVLTAWKEREAVYRRRRTSIAAENGGFVPAFATAGAAVEVAPTQRARRSERLTAPEDPDTVSKEEFEDMVRDLHVEPVRGATAVAAPKPKPKPKPKAPPEPAPPEIDPALDALPENTVMPDRPDPKAASRPKRSSSPAAKRRSKHGRPR